MPDFTFDDSFRQRVAKVSGRFDSNYWRSIYREKRFPDEYWSALSADGLFGTVIEKKWGGLGRNLLDLAVGVEETAERYAGLASYLYLSGSLVSTIFTKNGSEEQKKDLLPKLARGELKISIALTEEVSGFDSSAIETTAVKNPDGNFTIRGTKQFVNNVERADFLLVFARTTPASQAPKKSLGVTMFLVSPKDPSIRSVKLEKVGWDFIDNFAIDIKDLKVSAENIVGELDRAWYNIVDSFNMDRVATAASLVGTGRLALNQAAEYATKRKVFGRAIGSNQGIQFPMADAAAQLEAAEVMMLKAASIASKGGNFVNEANYAFLASEVAASAATDRAIQALGGHGYYSDYDVERYWRDVRAHKVHPISEELALALIAERSLNLPKSY
ncbi:MAG TPA: acyl-CoA dehydrogenase family protein [Nitrososphaerales archaeon]|nr:acyl-CoA dehydrogenase family protein [Nitrososphaerales archaeon]